MDPFENYAHAPVSSITAAMAVTPSDSDDLSVVTRAILVTAGDSIRVTFLNGSDLVVPVIPGVPYPYRVTKVWSTGTDATGIIALW